MMVKMDPPPRPMLWGFTSDVQIKAAMAASAAEPPFFSMSLHTTTPAHRFTQRTHKIIQNLYRTQ